MHIGRSNLAENETRAQAAPAARTAAPAWITPELVALTIKVWSPRYGRVLSSEEAIRMVLDVGRLFAVLLREREG